MAITNKPARGVFACLLAVVAAFAAPAVPAASAAPRAAASSPAVHSDRSAPLASLPPARNASHGQLNRPVRALPRHLSAAVPTTTAPPVTDVAALMPTPSTNFEGIGQGFTGPAGTFTVSSAPPDPNAAVGPNHVVEMVNTDIAVFNKSGTPVYGPVPTNTLWSGFGGLCQTNNDGDGTVAYDRIADRWVLAQFSVTTTPYTYCVAVSQTPDPTGAYNRYSFSYGNTDFIDYPKLGVWPDGYYTTYNVFTGQSFSTGRVCAFDRVRMLAGQPATQQCFDTGPNWGGLLPSDLAGTRMPAAGAPNTVLAEGTNSLGEWQFHVDWTTPANSSLTGPMVLTVGAFSDACGLSPVAGTCIPQVGTSQLLDSLGDRLMYRLAYRNFGDHEALVVSKSITTGSSVGVRWYELRRSAGAFVIFQEGTYAPDSNYRWMGSIAQDAAGDMALGFSLSGSSLHPEIHYTGRLAADPLGSMPQGEATVIDGAGSQTAGLSRWGDYTSMSVDPVDDCTFWYTNQYEGANGTFNWQTRIASFKFPNCGTVPNDFSISANPTSLTMAQGGSGTSTISTAVTSGSAATVTLSASAPAGLTATLNPTTVTAGGSSTLTVTADPAVTPNTYTVTVTGVEGSTSHSASVSVTVTGPPPPNDFSIAANPTSLSMAQGGSGTSTMSTAVTSGSASTVTLSAAAPTGLTASLSPTSVTAGGSATLTVTAPSAAAGTYSVTVTGTEGSATHSATVTITVTAPPPPNDFSISANPTSLSMAQGGSGSSTVSTAVTSGSAATVSFTASAPAGLTATLSPTSVTAGGSSTLTVTAGASTTPGPYTVTVTGTEGATTHSTSVSVTVTAAPSGIVNGGFETGNFAGWTSAGSTAVTTTPHSGTYAARVGSTSPFNGDSSIAQTFTVPTAGGSLSFYYKVVCTDTVTYDWALATLRDNTAGGTTTTVLPKTCSNTGAWVSRTATVIGGHSYTLTLVDHDDNYATDPTYTLFDDVTIVAPPPPPPTGITNGGFETGTLAGWTSAGSTAVVTTSHSGTYAARVGSTSPFSGDSSIAQTFAAPAAGGTLSFYYKVVCTDTVTYDWATVTLRDNTTGTTTTVLARTCTNAGAWVNARATLTGGHSYTLTLIDRDDNYPGDPTYTLFDDVVIS